MSIYVTYSSVSRCNIEVRNGCVIVLTYIFVWCFLLGGVLSFGN